MGLCVPASCSHDDIRQALQGTYDDFGNDNDIIVKVSVDEQKCQTRNEEPKLSTAGYVYWYRNENFDLHTRWQNLNLNNQNIIKNKIPLLKRSGTELSRSGDH